MSLSGNLEAGGVLRGKINDCDVLTISAYGVAVKNGFKGTEEEWLRSLEMSPSEIESAIYKYLSENPVAIDTTLTVAGQAADAKVTGDTINAHVRNKENPHAVTKSQVGLGDVDNTSDMNKPVSTAQAAAIDSAKNEAIRNARIKVVVSDTVPENVPALWFNVSPGGAVNNVAMLSLDDDETGYDVHLQVGDEIYGVGNATVNQGAAAGLYDFKVL